MSLSSKFSTLKATSTVKAPFVPLHSSSFIYLGQQQCEHCKMSFRNHSELLKHRKRCNRYRCPHCQRAFSERMINDFTCIVTSRKNSNTLSKYFTYSYQQLGNMRRHVQILHSGAKPYKCRLCSKAYR